MKNIALLSVAVLYVIIQSSGITSTAFYQGMSKGTVDGLLKEQQKNNPGMTYSFVTKTEFDAVVPAQVPANMDRQNSISDAKNISKTPQERLDALIKAIDLK